MTLIAKYEFDEGNTSSEAIGPFLNWHARETLDGEIPSRAFSVRTEDGRTDVTAQMQKASRLIWGHFARVGVSQTAHLALPLSGFGMTLPHVLMCRSQRIAERNAGKRVSPSGWR